MKLSLFCPNWLCTQIKADQSGRIPHISILLSSRTLPCGTLRYISLQYITVHYITVHYNYIPRDVLMMREWSSLPRVGMYWVVHPSSRQCMHTVLFFIIYHSTLQYDITVHYIESQYITIHHKTHFKTSHISILPFFADTALRPCRTPLHCTILHNCNLPKYTKINQNTRKYTEIH